MPAKPKPRTSADGREIELLDGLLPGLYALATGQPLPGREMPKMDPAMVDRVLKVLELRLKYKEADKPAKRNGPTWGAEVTPITGRERSKSDD